MKVAACCCTKRYGVVCPSGGASSGPMRHPVPLGLPADGLHGRLPGWWAGMVSVRALRLNRSEYRLPVGAFLCGASFA